MSIISASGQQGKVIVAKLPPNKDLFAAIHSLLSEHEITCGYIPVLQGCLKDCKFLNVSENPEQPGNPQDIEIEHDGPLVCSATGTIAQDTDGSPFIHLHPKFVSGDGTTYMGHLIAATVTLTTEIVIVEVQGLLMNRKNDPNVYDNVLLNIDQE